MYTHRHSCVCVCVCVCVRVCVCMCMFTEERATARFSYAPFKAWFWLRGPQNL